MDLGRLWIRIGWIASFLLVAPLSFAIYRWDFLSLHSILNIFGKFQPHFLVIGLGAGLIKIVFIRKYLPKEDAEKINPSLLRVVTPDGFLMMLWGPLEEIFYRGPFILIAKHYGWQWAMLLLPFHAFSFAVAHFTNYTFIEDKLTSSRIRFRIIHSTLSGIIYGILAVTSNSLFPGSISHAFLNAYSVYLEEKPRFVRKRNQQSF